MSDPPFTQQAYLKASNVGTSDSFGYTVAISGDTVVVGARNEDGNGDSQADDSASNSGAAYVFVRNGTSWTQQAYLKASNVDAHDNFGYSVAISGDTIVVGAYGESGDGSDEGNNSADFAGAAYVFVRTDTNWSQQDYLKASNANSYDFFGVSVAISGDTIVVGAGWEDGDGSSELDNTAPDAGAAYVFVRSNTSWSQQAYLKASNVDAGDYFGNAVAISEGTIVVGAYAEDGNGSSGSNNDAPSSGAAYIFVRAGTTWSQQAYLKASNIGSYDYFGYSVNLSADTVVIGAYGESGDGSGEGDDSKPGAGAVYVFVRSGITWSQQAYLKASNADIFDYFGYSVSISGETIIVSAGWEDGNISDQGNVVDDSGAAYVFVRSNTTWSQQAYLKASNVDANDYFGYSVAISGDSVVVGAYCEDGDGSNQADNGVIDSGAAYVFYKVFKTYSPLVMR